MPTPRGLRPLTVAAFAVCVRPAIQPIESKLSLPERHPVHAWLIAYAQKKEVSDFLVIGYLYLELNLNFIYVTSFTCIQLIYVLKYVDGLSAVSSLLLSLV